MYKYRLRCLIQDLIFQIIYYHTIKIVNNYCHLLIHHNNVLIIKLIDFRFKKLIYRLFILLYLRY